MTTGPPGVGHARITHQEAFIVTWEVVGLVGCLYLPCQHNNDKNMSKIMKNY